MERMRKYLCTSPKTLLHLFVSKFGTWNFPAKATFSIAFSKSACGKWAILLNVSAVTGKGKVSASKGERNVIFARWKFAKSKRKRQVLRTPFLSADRDDYDGCVMNQVDKFFVFWWTGCLQSCLTFRGAISSDLVGWRQESQMTILSQRF